MGLSLLLVRKLRHGAVVELACKEQSEDGDPLAQHWPGLGRGQAWREG